MATAYDTLAHLLQSANRMQEALLDCQKAAEIRQTLLEDSPDESEYRLAVAQSHSSLAMLLAAMGRNEEAKASAETAITQYRELIRQRHKFPIAYEGLARLLSTFSFYPPRDASQAVRLAETAVKLAPEYRPHWQTLCIAQYRAGNWQEAVSAMQESEKVAVDWDLHARLFAAMAYWQMDNKEEAQRLYHETVKKIEENQPLDEELNRFRAEAADSLQVTKEPEEEKDSDNASTSKAP